MGRPMTTPEGKPEVLNAFYLKLRECRPEECSKQAFFVKRSLKTSNKHAKP
jgi:hypothetical protein